MAGFTPAPVANPSAARSTRGPPAPRACQTARKIDSRSSGKIPATARAIARACPGAHSVALRLISLASFGNMVAAVLAIVGARDGFAFEASHTKARTSRFFPALSAAVTTAAHLSLSPAFNSAITGATISAALVGSALTASKTAAPNCSAVADATVTPGGSDRGAGLLRATSVTARTPRATTTWTKQDSRIGIIMVKVIQQPCSILRRSRPPAQSRSRSLVVGLGP